MTTSKSQRDAEALVAAQTRYTLVNAGWKETARQLATAEQENARPTPEEPMTPEALAEYHVVAQHGGVSIFGLTFSCLMPSTIEVQLRERLAAVLRGNAICAAAQAQRDAEAQRHVTRNWIAEHERANAAEQRVRALEAVLRERCMLGDAKHNKAQARYKRGGMPNVTGN